MAPEVNLNHIFRGNLHGAPDVAIQELMRAILIRTQFLPTVRHVIGWRGLKQSLAEVEGWTSRVKDFAGVFGLFFMGIEPTPGWTTGLFGLCYFPDPQELLVERCSLQAAAFTQRDDFHSCIRDFLQDSEVRSLFGVGTLLLSVHPDHHSLALVLQSVSAQRTIARDGVNLPQDGKRVPVIDPGGFDRDFPAFATALGFFNVLAASVSFNLEQPPCCLIERKFPATQRVYARSGSVSSESAPDLWNGLLVLGYGEGDFDALCSAISTTENTPISAVRADSPDTAPRDYQENLWWHAHQLKDSKSIDKKILGVDERPPLIILTGFLGAGKTSFLQHFIEYQTQRHRFVAVIQNEIGEIGLDGKLLDYTVTEIDEGCVCCSLAGNLKRAVQGILSNFHPDTIVLEMTGLANPLNLLEDMTEMGDVVRFDTTVTLVDALNLESTLSDYRIAFDQITAADILVLNKLDLVSDSQKEEAARRVREINPDAPLFFTTHGALNPALIFDADEPEVLAVRKTAVIPAYQDIPALHPSHAQDGLWCRSLRLPRKLDRAKFMQAVATLPRSIFRLKGLIDFTDSSETMLFQYVAGRFELSVFPHPGIPDRFLTVIGNGTDPQTKGALEGLSMVVTG